MVLSVVRFQLSTKHVVHLTFRGLQYEDLSLILHSRFRFISFLGLSKTLTHCSTNYSKIYLFIYLTCRMVQRGCLISIVPSESLWV